MRYAILVGSLALIGATGCASTSLRTEQSSSAIRAAEELGAKDVPRASLHLQLAKESKKRAISLAARGDGDQARSLLARAEADAELAVALSREDSERQEAINAVEELRQLRLANPQRSM